MTSDVDFSKGAKLILTNNSFYENSYDNGAKAVVVNEDSFYGPSLVEVRLEDGQQDHMYKSRFQQDTNEQMTFNVFGPSGVYLGEATGESAPDAFEKFHPAADQVYTLVPSDPALYVDNLIKLRRTQKITYAVESV